MDSYIAQLPLEVRARRAWTLASACRGTGWIGQIEAAPLLMAHLHDPHPRIRRLVLDAPIPGYLHANEVRHA